MTFAAIGDEILKRSAAYCQHEETPMRLGHRHSISLLLAWLLVSSLSSPASADVVDFQQGSDGYSGTEDTFLVQDGVRDAANWGDLANAYVGPFAGGPTADEMNRALLRFDVFSLAGLYQQITRLTLSLSVADASGSPNAVELRQPVETNGDWVEGSAAGHATSGTSSWANKHHPTTPWTGGPGLGTTGAGPSSRAWRTTRLRPERSSS